MDYKQIFYRLYVYHKQENLTSLMPEQILPIAIIPPYDFEYKYGYRSRLQTKQYLITRK